MPLIEDAEKSRTRNHRLSVKPPVHQSSSTLQLLRREIIAAARVLKLPFADRYWSFDVGIQQLVAMLIELQVKDIEVDALVLGAHNRYASVVVVDNLVVVPCYYTVNSSFR